MEQENEKIEISDRYSALGIQRPDAATVCKGQCEGVGYFPEDDQSSPLWQEAHTKPHKEKELVEWCGFGDREDWANCNNCVTRECDGWHFIKCPDCNGTGKNDGTSVWPKEPIAE